jgi:hypothetical protein
MPLAGLKRPKTGKNDDDDEFHDRSTAAYQTIKLLIHIKSLLSCLVVK